MNLDIIRKVIKYSHKSSCEGDVYSHRFRDIAVPSVVGIMTHTAGPRERVTISVKKQKQKSFGFYWQV